MYIKSCDQTVYVLQSESPLLQGFLLSVLGKWEDLLHDNTEGQPWGLGVWGVECREEGIWGWCRVSATLAVLLAHTAAHVSGSPFELSQCWQALSLVTWTCQAFSVADALQSSHIWKQLRPFLTQSVCQNCCLPRTDVVPHPVAVAAVDSSALSAHLFLCM